jgi:transposase
LKALGVLGLDEIALTKGHRDFVTIVSARLPSGELAVLAVLPDRCKETVKSFLASIPERLKATDFMSRRPIGVVPTNSVSKNSSG